MSIVHENSTVYKRQNDTSRGPQGCLLACELGNRPIRRKDCGSFHEALVYFIPPYNIRLFVRDQIAGDKPAQDWLKQLNDVLPEQYRLFPRGGW